MFEPIPWLALPAVLTLLRGPWPMIIPARAARQIVQTARTHTPLVRHCQLQSPWHCFSLSALATHRAMTQTAAFSSSAAIETSTYRPFLLSPIPGAESKPSSDGTSGKHEEPDWTLEAVEDLEAARALGNAVFGQQGGLRVLVLYGSLRERCVRTPHATFAQRHRQL